VKSIFHFSFVSSVHVSFSLSFFLSSVSVSLSLSSWRTHERQVYATKRYGIYVLLLDISGYWLTTWDLSLNWI
jgi:hypothetical protein